jgi:cyanophycin synthetase
MEHTPAITTVEIPQEFLGEFHFDEDMELIRDERGVRIAREAED